MWVVCNFDVGSGGKVLGLDGFGGRVLAGFGGWVLGLFGFGGGFVNFGVVDLLGVGVVGSFGVGDEGFWVVGSFGLVVGFWVLGFTAVGNGSVVRDSGGALLGVGNFVDSVLIGWEGVPGEAGKDAAVPTPAGAAWVGFCELQKKKKKKKKQQLIQIVVLHIYKCPTIYFDCTPNWASE